MKSTELDRCRGCGCKLSIVQSVRGLCDNPQCRRKDVGYQEQQKRQATLQHIRQNLPPSWPSNIAIAILPRNTRRLVPLSSARIKAHRQHLEQIIQEAKTLSHQNETTATTSGISPAQTELPVLDAACGLCRGDCCYTGGTTAWLEAATIQRLQWQNIPVSETRIVEYYLSYLPEISFENSCIYHAENGCSLPRKIRSNVCNQFLCRGLAEVVTILSAEPGMGVAASMRGNTSNELALIDSLGILDRTTENTAKD